MLFTETKLKGAYIIRIEALEDERGFFARTYCQREFEEHGIDMNIVQCDISYNKMKGTLRGMHYQADPYEEAKIVSCIKGSMYDVIIDLRKDSSTYCKWMAVELSEVRSEQLTLNSNSTTHRLQSTAYHTMLYIPKGFAHGFLTLKSDTQIFYYMSESYAPGYSRGVRWNDPAFGIEWPEEVSVISDQDQAYPDFTP